eukprot:2673245-Alexandrium_andersonii.AAC.1
MFEQRPVCWKRWRVEITSSLRVGVFAETLRLPVACDVSCEANLGSHHRAREAAIPNLPKRQHLVFQQFTDENP